VTFLELFEKDFKEIMPTCLGLKGFVVVVVVVVSESFNSLH